MRFDGLVSGKSPTGDTFMTMRTGARSHVAYVTFLRFQSPFSFFRSGGVLGNGSNDFFLLHQLVYGSERRGGDVATLGALPDRATPSHGKRQYG